MTSEGFVGVHIGAGQHSEARKELYLSICAKACQKAVEILKQGGNAIDAAASATMVLEDAGETNAGYGSNLSELGTVEMDAGLMDGDSLLFGAVGAVPGIKNPIMVAKMLVQEQRKGLLPLGRVPPGFLVGEGARDWAQKKGVPVVTEKSLISDKAAKLYKHYKKKLDFYRQQTSQQKRPLNMSHNESGVHSKRPHHSLDDHVTDTVGVVVLDCNGKVASTVSSGGIALKQPGRVGQAAVFGCGCWAQKGNPSKSAYTVGISTTGCGEHLVRTFLAKECALHLRSTRRPLLSLQNCMKEKFAESDFLNGVPEKLGGAICMHYDETHGRGQFLWTHTTASMGLAYQTTADANPTTVMSRINNLPLAKGAGMYILTESIPFTTKKGHANSKGPCSLDSQESSSTCEVESASAKA
eukprot:09424.XXX_436702_435346_1 [CDS] Oithona nana genome sequencing.